MLGIKLIEHYIPDNGLDNFKQVIELGRDESFITEKIGAHFLPKMDLSEDTADLAFRAAQKLVRNGEVDPLEIDCICVCTQNPHGSGLPHTSAIVQSKLGCGNHCAAFDISLGCSGYVYGLAVITGFMKQAGLKRGILITADPYSKIIDPADENTSLLFGDAATATLIDDDPVLELGASIFCTDGSKGDALKNIDSKLHMNGRQVFNFAATEVPKQINELLVKCKIEKEKVDLFVMHQGSKFIVETITKKMSLPISKVPVAIEKTGNTVSSSIPLILESTIDQREIKSILISGFGVGLSWASMMLNKTNKGK